VLDLKTRIQFEEIECILCRRMEELYCSCRDVAYESRKSDCGLFHLFKSLGTCNGHGRFFDNLLVPSLDRTVSSKERDGIAVLISEDLDFEMSG
jgi:hypothetical protein